MQSRNGGWGSFDADNTHYYLNHIPFADHGALLDPPTADVSARCLGFLAQIGFAVGSSRRSRRRLEFLRREQEPEGSWFGRWGTNFIYGTWSVLAAPQRGRASSRRRLRCGARSIGCCSHSTATAAGAKAANLTGPRRRMAMRRYSTPSQTAWALLGLMAAGEVEHPAVARGIDYLIEFPGPGRKLGRALVHRRRLPARLLFALPRLPRLFSALGARSLSAADDGSCRRDQIRHLISGWSRSLHWALPALPPRRFVRSQEPLPRVEVSAAE